MIAHLLLLLFEQLALLTSMLLLIFQRPLQLVLRLLQLPLLPLPDTLPHLQGEHISRSLLSFIGLFFRALLALSPLCHLAYSAVPDGARGFRV